MDIRPDLLAEVSHLVDVRNLHRKKGVAGIFDQLRGFQAGHQYRRLDQIERAVEGAKHILGAFALGTHHHTVGTHEITDRGALAKKFRVGRDVEIGVRACRPDDGLDLAAGADGDCRFGDDHRVAGQVPSQFTRRIEDIGQVGMTVTATRRRPDSDENRIRFRDHRTKLGGEMKPVCRHIARDKVLKPGLIDRHDAGLDADNLIGILVDAGDVEPEFGKAGPRYKTDIPRSDDRQLHLVLPRSVKGLPYRP